MQTTGSGAVISNIRNRIDDLAQVGEELADDELLLAAGGQKRQRVIEIRCYDECGNHVDTEIYYVDG